MACKGGRRRRRRSASERCGQVEILGSAGTAMIRRRNLTRGTLALQLALRGRAVGRFAALVVARELLTHRMTRRRRSRALCTALSRLTNRLTLWTSVLLALILWTPHGTHGLFTTHGAFDACGLFALHSTARAAADRVAHGRARGVVALPVASGVTALSRERADGDVD